MMALANRSACLEQFFMLDRQAIFKKKKQHVSGPCSFVGEVTHTYKSADIKIVTLFFGKQQVTFHNKMGIS